jgi:hypothetical protein
MATNSVFNYLSTKYDDLSSQLTTWLKTSQNKSDILFSDASPYGQMVNTNKEVYINSILYVKNAVNQFTIDNATDERVLANLARISGHNPTRAISATGTIKMRLKVGINISDEIAGSKIKIYDRTQLKNKSNNLYYNIVLGSEYSIYEILPDTSILLNIIQGRYESQKYTGTGLQGQSYAVVIKSTQNIENFNFAIFYNGVLLSKRDHLYDMLPNELACYTRTGFSGGLDIYFGNSDYGFVPDIGSIIEVRYLLSDGRNGNILNNKVNDFTYVGDLVDNDGNILNVENLFDTTIENDITFGSDKENKVLTKSIIPYVSRNFVLATPPQFIFQLKKQNKFSLINAYNTLDDTNTSSNSYIDNFITMTFGNNVANIEKVRENMKYYFPNVFDNIMYLFLIPNIVNYFQGDFNYFNIPLDAFYLDEYEKTKTLDYLKMMGTISITTSVKIIDPVLSFYTMNVYIRRNSNILEDNLRNVIISNVSTYFVYNDRFDRIVRSDIIRLIKNIDGVDSVNVEFISKKNEDYHRNRTAQNQNQNIPNTNISSSDQYLYPTAVDTTRYDINRVLGLDPIQGDIITDKNELAVLRGGWYDRNQIYYNDIPVVNGLSTINIIWTGVNN